MRTSAVAAVVRCAPDGVRQVSGIASVMPVCGTVAACSCLSHSTCAHASFNARLSALCVARHMSCGGSALERAAYAPFVHGCSAACLDPLPVFLPPARMSHVRACSSMRCVRRSTRRVRTAASSLRARRRRSRRAPRCASRFGWGSPRGGEGGGSGGGSSASCHLACVQWEKQCRAGSLWHTARTKAHMRLRLFSAPQWFSRMRRNPSQPLHA